MDAVTLSRTDWAAVARDLDVRSGSHHDAPSGLRIRIGSLLADAPAGWRDQQYTLDLDPPAAAIVRAIVRRGRDLPAHPERDSAAATGVAVAEAIVREHQHSPAVYRIEHRSADSVSVIGQSSAADAAQAELSLHAARLIAAGWTGELVLVDEATGRDVARRRLTNDNDENADESDEPD